MAKDFPAYLLDPSDSLGGADLLGRGGTVRSMAGWEGGR